MLAHASRCFCLLARGNDGSLFETRLEIKGLLGQLSKKFDALVEEREAQSIMTVSEKSLKDFLTEEPNIYSMSDLKVVYSGRQD